jgi:hypothetical protein
MAGAAAPRRRKGRATTTNSAVARLHGLEAHLRSQLPDNKATSGRVSWAAAMKACWKVDMLVCECGGKRSQVSLIQQPAVLTKMLAHLMLPTELHTRGDPLHRTRGASANTGIVRGPPDELLPWDVSETSELLLEADEGPPVDAVNHEPNLPLFADDLTARGPHTVAARTTPALGGLAEPHCTGPKPPDLPCIFAVGAATLAGYGDHNGRFTLLAAGRGAKGGGPWRTVGVCEPYAMVHAWTSRGHLKRRKVGGARVFDLAEVQAFAQARGLVLRMPGQDSGPAANDNAPWPEHVDELAQMVADSAAERGGLVKRVRKGDAPLDD